MASTNLKSSIKKVLSKCTPCKIENSKPIKQLMGQLPKERTSVCESVFSNTCIDYFGLIIVKQEKRTRFTSGYNKLDGVVLNWLTTRASHLELAEDLNADAFILALKIYIAKREQPTTIYSNNGSNFSGIEKEIAGLTSKFNFTNVNKTLMHCHISWKHIPPSNPLMRGARELIVKLMKRILKIVTHNRQVSQEILIKFLAEIEAILNIRGLASASDDPIDFNV